jgi:uncharacterized integral membrane protein (TIGR00698 family)
MFILGLAAAASGYLSPPVALAVGIAYGLIFFNPWRTQVKRLSQLLLQASVVGLGFGMNLAEIWRVSRSGFLYTALTITTAVVLGLTIGRLVKVERTPALLITVGTAICGGSAIAAVGPITKATDDEMAVSLGTVFVLNSVALMLFPLIGWSLHLSQTQFGLWAALAIHDTSSVVGATARYGTIALAVGTTVKLARALWILPVSAGTAMIKKTGKGVKWPWFILFFCLAALLNTAVPALHPAWSMAAKAGKLGLIVTLYLIGAGLSRETLKQVGIRPFVQGVVLWFVVATGSLALIRAGWISL